MARPRKYTPIALERAVNAYFRKISRNVTVTEEVDTGKRDEMGHRIFEQRPVLNEAGEEIKIREFAIPPTVSGICVELGIDRRTWANYAADEAHYGRVIDRVRTIIESYLEGELLTRKKGVQGVIFALQNRGYGFSHKMDMGEETSKALTSGSMTMEEKMELIRAAAAEANDNGGNGD